jgi:hypothetical protein
MAMTKRELFSFARKCKWFLLRIESSVAKGEGSVTLIIARYHGPDSNYITANPFPARMLRKAFDYAQQKSNELRQEVKVVMAARLIKEYEGSFGFFGVKTFRPAINKTLSSLPVLTCSSCSKPATQQLLSFVDSGSYIEHCCDQHVGEVRAQYVGT